MTHKFELHELKAAYEKGINRKHDEISADIEAFKNEILSNPENFTARNLDTFRRMAESRERFYYEYLSRESVNLKMAKLTEAYEMFDRIACDLLSDEDENNVEVLDDEIIFDGYGSLSRTAQLLSALYGFHSGSFSFNNAFSSHEAYTNKTNYFFRIESTNTGRVAIKFGFMRYFDEDFMSDVIW